MDQMRIIRLDDYEQHIGQEAVDRIRAKADALKGLHVTNVNSTFYGGGVAEILTSLTVLMNDLGLRAGWRVIQGIPDFFTTTKKMHNALQGGKATFSKFEKDVYEHVVYENSLRNHLESHDIVVIHDPQPLPFINHYRRRGPWIWRCHIDLSNPNKALWKYLHPLVEQYDAVVLSIKEFKQKLKVPQVLIMPAINPFTIKNQVMGEHDIEEKLSQYKIPTDLPIISQVSRYDRWKDPEGVIKAFKIARKKADATLVLLGNAATDDPEGSEIYESLLKHKEERILILPYGDDSLLVNALQSHSAIVMQKSLREGFGLTVTEAMWKGTPVIAGNCGGIRYQIKDGYNGYLVSSVEEAAKRMVDLLQNPKKRMTMGDRARESVKRNFLMTRLLEQYLDLFSSFEATYRLKRNYQ